MPITYYPSISYALIEDKVYMFGRWNNQRLLVLLMVENNHDNNLQQYMLKLFFVVPVVLKNKIVTVGVAVS